MTQKGSKERENAGLLYLQYLMKIYANASELLPRCMGKGHM